MNSNLKKLTTTAVLTALVCVMTLIVKIPTPTKGYVNLGDCFVIISGWILGPVYGAFAGGVGSALADLFAGYPLYIPGTLIIKALMSLEVALIHKLFANKGVKSIHLGLVVASVIAEVIMVLGYYIYEAVVAGYGFVGALAGISGNAVQGAIGAVAAFILWEAINRSGVLKHIL